MFKMWGVGDITNKDIDEQFFNHIEAPVGSDVNNHITLQRAFRNLYEIQKDTYEILRDIINTSTRKASVFKEGDFDPEKITVGGIDYIIVKPGVAFINNNIFVNRPLVHIASRQLEKIFNLTTWAIESYREYVEIEYDGKFSATIKANGVEYSFGPFDTGIALLESIKSEGAFSSSLSSVSLINIKLEPIFLLDSGGYLGLSDDGEFYFSSTSGNSNLYRLNSDGSIHTDSRVYFHEYNKFENGIELNSKDTAQNEDTSISVIREDGDDAVIKWSEAPSRFEINKDLDVDGTISTNKDIEIGSGVALTTTSTKTLRFTVEVNIESISIAFPVNLDFNELEDTLMVYENSIYLLEEKVEYNIDNNKITVGNGYHKGKFETGKYQFIVIKKVRSEEIE